MEGRERIDTTLGDLIVALTEATAPFVSDQREASRLVAFMLADILSHSDAVMGEPEEKGAHERKVALH